MKRLFTIIGAAVFLCSISIQSFSQVSQGGTPYQWQAENNLSEVSFLRTPDLDMATIAAEDQENDQYKEFAYRFGIEHAVSLNPETDGTWSTDGRMNIWRQGITCPDAVSISVLFTEFDLPANAKIFIYDAEKTHFIGSFTSANRQANGSLATSLVYSENIIVEFQVPTHYTTDDWELSIDQIVHGYRGFHSKFEELKGTQRGPFGNSGACNININCPEGDDWQVEKKGVAIITSGGNAVCSGTLVNNTANDGHPYFLTADHCLGGVGNWVFYFNHESTTCGGNTGPTNQSVSGATVVASNGGSDFGLLEINNGNTIPAAYDPEWVGWDNSDSEAAVSSATGIHHPSGDVKKICHETDAPYHANQGGAAVWYIDEWEEGVTEGGSSGSALFNQDHRLIGQLYGGYAACSGSVNNGQADWYGRFGVSWDGSSASTRLRDWLDPGNSGVTTLDGYPTGAVSYNLDAAAGGLTDVPSVLCTPSSVQPSFTLSNNGTTSLTSCTIVYAYNGGTDQTINWTGNLAQGATESVQLAAFTPVAGTNTITVTVSSPNGQTDENNNNNSTNVSFELTVGEDVLYLSLVTDGYGYDTYWEVRGPSNQLIASGGNTNVGANGGGNQTAQPGDPGAYGDDQTITETIQLDGPGCYEFIIVDDYGDGICCAYGNGSYTLTDGNGAVMASGGEFSSDETTEFGMTSGPLTPPTAAFTAASTEICVPGSVTFTNTSTPNFGATYAWTFENGTPATSSAQNPTVTYNSAGTFDVSLTVTNSEGSDSASQTDYITVNPTPSATTTSTVENLWTGGSNGTATANATGGTPPYSYSWSPGNGTGMTITGLVAADYTVTVTDSKGCTATSTVTVGNTVGIQNLELAESIAVYPNPTSGVLHIEFPLETGIIDVTVSDVVGRMIRKINVVGLQQTTIDFTGLTEGMYHLNFYTADKTATKKVVLIKD